VTTGDLLRFLGKRLQVQLVDSSGPISSGNPYSVPVSKTIPKKNNGEKSLQSDYGWFY
jgi:hypothetical protein